MLLLTLPFALMSYKLLPHVSLSFLFVKQCLLTLAQTAMEQLSVRLVQKVQLASAWDNSIKTPNFMNVSNEMTIVYSLQFDFPHI